MVSGCQQASDVDAKECKQHARIATEATEKYRSVSRAVEDGFGPAGDLATGEACVDAQSEGEDAELGAMGEHWVKGDRIFDQDLSLEEPEILLYIPTGHGDPSDDNRKLIAVEWSAPALAGGASLWYGPAPPLAPSAPPRLFGRAFDGPMQGHEMLRTGTETHVTVQPWHYDIHVWLWEENPSGLFAHYNPRLSCTPGA